MAVEDYLEPEVAVAVALTAAVASPRARQVMRKGAVYGIAGVLKAGDALGAFSRGVGRGAKQAMEATAAATPDPSDDSEAILAPRPARKRAGTRASGPAATATDSAREGTAAGADATEAPE